MDDTGSYATVYQIESDDNYWNPKRGTKTYPAQNLDNSFWRWAVRSAGNRLINLISWCFV